MFKREPQYKKSYSIPEFSKFQKLTLKDGTEVSIYDIARAMKAEHFAALMEDWLNNFNGPNPEVVAAMVTTTHRTLQQTFIRFFVQVLTWIPAYTWGTDPRNEAGVNLCREIDRITDDTHLPFI